jgi:thiamine pyrophosphate-dependent acetolactate synthase large subunit-like protein/nitrite reductase/ring-hydroxylating ferredoxin subunit
MSSEKRVKKKISWYKVADLGSVAPDRVMTVTAGTHQICLVNYKDKITALDNHCPHQGGPLGEGQIENGWVICPWHAYEYHPVSGKAPEGFEDCAQPYPVELRKDGIYVAIEEEIPVKTISDQMVKVMTDWGVKVVFGMVGHSNLGFADAMHQAEKRGNLKFIGIRHEGAAAFAASAYAKLTGGPAACFAIAGPGATNMITGMWDAHVDNVPLLVLAGQVNTQVMGPGTFQEVDLPSAYLSVTRWQQVVLGSKNASDLMALAIKHAIVEHGPTALILPDEIQQLPAIDPLPESPMEGRIANTEIAPPANELRQAIKMINRSKRPSIIVGNGARTFSDQIIKFAEKIQAPIITTFKAKGLVSDSHPLACGVLGRSGIPVASMMMGTADLLIVLGASFSVHTGIAEYIPTIQVDRDPMILGKFHPVTLPLWGDIGITLTQIKKATQLKPVKRPEVKKEIASRWEGWRTEKKRREKDVSKKGINSAAVFDTLSKLAPDEAVICVDVGNNTYSFGRYFECKQQSVLMSGYLGSIGFAFPAAMGAWAAKPDRKIIAVAGDGGFGQYLAEFTTAIKYEMPITLILLNNKEIGKISKEFLSDNKEVWHTSLHNPGFAEYAKLCGGEGIRISKLDDLESGIAKGLQSKKASIVEIVTDPLLI